MILFSTWQTPGEAHAALSASMRSDQESTDPPRITPSPLVSTLIPLASYSVSNECCFDIGFHEFPNRVRFDHNVVVDVLYPG